MKNGAGDRDRTGICSLEGCRSTIELRPLNTKIRFKNFLVANKPAACFASHMSRNKHDERVLIPFLIEIKEFEIIF